MRQIYEKTYAVYFRAEIYSLDDNYSKMAQELRDLAINKYGCTEFVAVMEGAQEIAISYWQNLEHINNWKQDLTHLAVQELGRSVCYKSYSVQFVEVIRSYGTDI